MSSSTGTIPACSNTRPPRKLTRRGLTFSAGGFQLKSFLTSFKSVRAGYNHTMEIPTDPVLKFEEAVRDLNEFMARKNRSVFGRYPLIFSLLGTFGIISILYGFDALLEEIPLVKEHPLIPIVFGIVLLIITGSLYKRLERKSDEA